MQILTSPGVPIKAWVDGVELEDAARQQLLNVAALPIVGPHVAVMPDVHWGMGCTVGAVVPTRGAIIPAAVGVDLGCGMIAARTTLDANAIDVKRARMAIEDAVPIGGPGVHGSWNEPRFGGSPRGIEAAWDGLWQRWAAIPAPCSSRDSWNCRYTF